ncbi:hypothetical protein SPHINGOR109_10292 [Sphingorhabdus sp. 109]|nr:hypothetical protein SPHINGOR109_10292 [Sphingorhabdus sp. 109]
MVIHEYACAYPLRLPTRNWSSHLMILVRLIRSGLRLPFSDCLRSSTERSFSSSCEKQTARLDHLPVSGLSCGSLLTDRWFVRLPSDDLYMTLQAESHLEHNHKLSTAQAFSGGKLLPEWWIKVESRIFACSAEKSSAGPAFHSGGGGERTGPLDQSRRLFGRRMRQPGL